jgi:hypothetical protein
VTATDLVRAQHAELDLFLRAAIDADADGRARLLRTIGDRFEAHAIMEETVFYPTFATGKDTAVLMEYARDHQVVRRALAELVGRPDLATSVQIEAVRRLIQRHAIDEEEAHLLPLVERTLSPAQLEELGDEMLTLYNEVMQRGEWRALDADSRSAQL